MKQFWPNRYLARIVSLCAALLSPVDAFAQDTKPWWPANGAVVLSGGGTRPAIADSLVDRLITLAGGAEALIVVIPTAHDGLPSILPSSAPEPTYIKNLRGFFASRGARNVVFLHTRDRLVANTDTFVTVLRAARGVFFTGGAFGVLDRTYHGTLVESEIKALLARGGVLVGDSAGAITLGCFSLKWNRTLNALAKATDGLCVFPRVTVTPHVQKIGGDEQTTDIARFVTAHPPTVGINLSENTFLVIRGGIAEVIGTGGATILDPAIDANKPYVHLSAGQRRDLARTTPQ